MEQKIKEAIMQELGFEVEVTKMEVTKNNGVVRTGYAIKKNGENVAPTIYIDPNDSDDDQIANVVEVYKGEAMKPNIDSEVSDIFSSADNVYRTVIPTIVSGENVNDLNKRDVMHERFLDMEVYYRVIINMTERGVGSVKITNEIIKKLDISIDKLRESALRNVEEMAVIRNMNDVLIAMGMPKEMIPMELPQSPMYVATTNNQEYGASIIVSEKVLDGLHKEMDCDAIYILPSSIHEVIAVSTEQGTVEQLKAMVSEINASEVAPQDVLTNNIYLHRIGEKLEVA